jgi:hypothetical protein
MRSFIICTTHRILSVDQIKENVLGGARDITEGEEKYLEGFGWETRVKRPLGKPMRRVIVLKWISKKWVGSALTVLTWLKNGTSSGL